jgi:hypothetical protein
LWITLEKKRRGVSTPPHNTKTREKLNMVNFLYQWESTRESTPSWSPAPEEEEVTEEGGKEEAQEGRDFLSPMKHVPLVHRRAREVEILPMAGLLRVETMMDQFKGGNLDFSHTTLDVLRMHLRGYSIGKKNLLIQKKKKKGKRVELWHPDK